MKLKTVAMTGVMSLAGLGLIGAGAHAQWTTSTQSNQNITAGTLSLVLTSPTAVSGDNTTILQLASVGPVGSSFMSTPQQDVINNNGSLDANEINMQVADTPDNGAGTAVASGVSMCLYSDGEVTFNGLLSAFESAGNFGWVGSIPSGGTDTYWVVLYSGTQDTGCGSVSGLSNALYPQSPGTSVAPELLTAAEGGTDTVSVTVTYQEAS
jgi:hypothetical protein